MIAVVGGADDAEIDKAYEMGVTAVFPIKPFASGLLHKPSSQQGEPGLYSR